MVVRASRLPAGHWGRGDAAWAVARWPRLGHSVAQPRSPKNGPVVGYRAIDPGKEGCRCCSGNSCCYCAFVEHLLGPGTVRYRPALARWVNLAEVFYHPGSSVHTWICELVLLHSLLWRDIW